MIRDKSLFCKLLRIKKTGKSVFDTYMKDFSPESHCCPCCNSNGNLALLCYYGRNLIDFTGKIEKNYITVTRVICKSCGHTHAVLPDVIVPYETHSLLFILRVLGDYFLHLMTVEKLCERYDITPKRLYEWIYKFMENKDAWLGIAQSMETSELRFLKRLSIKPEFSDFTFSFIERFRMSFMQTHAIYAAFKT